MEVRRLTDADAATYQAVRLQALRNHPEAFASSVEDEQNRTLDEVAQMLNSAGRCTWGTFVDDALVGIVTMSHDHRQKTKHRAMLTGMYVLPEARGHGVGEQLVQTALQGVQDWQWVEDVVLAVTVGNTVAKHLYERAGFATYAVEPRYIKVANQYFDLEWMIRRNHVYGR